MSYSNPGLSSSLVSSLNQGIRNKHGEATVSELANRTQLPEDLKNSLSSAIKSLDPKLLKSIVDNSFSGTLKNNKFGEIQTLLNQASAYDKSLHVGAPDNILGQNTASGIRNFLNNKNNLPRKNNWDQYEDFNKDGKVPTTITEKEVLAHPDTRSFRDEHHQAVEKSAAAKKKTDNNGIS